MEKDNEALITRSLELSTTKPGVMQRVADHGLAGVIAVMGFLVPLLLIGLFFESNGVIAFIVLSGAALFLHRLLLSADADDRREALERRLREHLAERGITEEDTSEAAQRERANFWREAQTGALLELRQRRLQLADTTTTAHVEGALDASRTPLAVFTFFWGGLTLLSVMLGNQSSRDVQGCLVVSFILYAAIAGVALSTRALTRELRSNNARAELDREIRHVAGLMDAAGGLSLADEQVEATLRGALSSDVAQGGELEEVKRG